MIPWLILVLAILVFCLLIREAIRLPCCPRGEGCNESGYVAFRKCHYTEAYEKADEIERAGLFIALRKVQRTRPLTPARKRAERGYSALRDACLTNHAMIGAGE